MSAQTSEINVSGLSLAAKFAVEQGQKFFPITHRKAIMGLSVNTLTLSESLEIEVSAADNTITINPIVQQEISRIDNSITNLSETLNTEISTQIDNLWNKVNGMNYAGSDSPGGPATSAYKLDSPFYLELSGDASGSVKIDGSGNVTMNVEVAKTRNNYAGANEDGGPAISALRLATVRNINITGDEIGTAEFDGSGDVTIHVTENHTHSEYSLTTHNHDTVYSKLDHTHSYAGSSSVGGAANSAVKLTTARAITISGAVTGSVSFDGTSNVTISTAVNHTHSQYALTSHNHDGVYAAASHSHSYLPLSGGTMTGNLSNNARYYQNGVLANLSAVQSGSPSTGNVLWAY